MAGLRDCDARLRIRRRGIAMTADDRVEERLLFLKSWNEWAEGNHLEPDLKFGRGYLDVIREELQGSGVAMDQQSGCL